MKNALLIAALILGSTAMAEGTAPAAPAAPAHGSHAAPATAPASATPAAPATVGKMNKHDAKKECLKENKELKGAKLADCVKAKGV